MLKPAKAAARLLKIVRPAQNVPRGSFEAQKLFLLGFETAAWHVLETAYRANRKAHGGTMAKPAGRFESCCGGLCGAEAFESCCLRGF